MRRAILPVVALALFAAACAKNPVTGKRQLALISENQEIQMGQQYKQEIAQTMGLYPDESLQQYVDRIGQQLAKTSERPDIPWSFQVIDDPTVNAFALPGGPIFVTRGILSHMNSEAELAGVLGHEIAHVTARHSVQQISRAQLSQLGLGLGMVFVPELRGALGQVAGAGLQLMLMSHGRDAEREADRLGFNYMLKHQYDVRAMSEMFQTLERASNLQEKGGKLPEWLSTHPNPENRVAANQERVAKLEGDLSSMTVDRAEYLQRIGGIVFGPDPRKGFFRGALFLHPEMRFQLTFPTGWKTQNLPQVVAAISPQQDAAFLFGHGGEGSPQEQLRKFLAQDGVQPGSAAAGTVTGFPSASATFAAQTEQGPVEGLITFLSYGGKTFQVIGYTKGGNLGTYMGAFQTATASFGELTDPSALNVQPARLEVVTVPRDMTVNEFQQQFPSTIPAAEVAVINGLPLTGSFKAGQAAKRVIGGVPPQS